MNRALPDWLRTRWLLGWRDITSITNERTVIASIVPHYAVGDKFLLMLSRMPAEIQGSLLANLNSLPFDFFARQKLGGTSLKFFTMRQLPIIPPTRLSDPAPWSREEPINDWLRSRVIELVYTAWDLRDFACDAGYSGAPYRWDDDRRFFIRCEIDAAFFQLYTLTRDDLCHVMNTFPTLKRRDEQRFGEYRTNRVILEIYDEMEQAKTIGLQYKTRLDPPPGDARATHQGLSTEGNAWVHSSVLGDT